MLKRIQATVMAEKSDLRRHDLNVMSKQPNVFKKQIVISV